MLCVAIEGTIFSIDIRDIDSELDGWAKFDPVVFSAMDEDVKLISEGKRKERRFLRAAVITAVIVAAFFIGFSIGYEVWSNRGDDGRNDGKTDDFRKRHEEIMNHHRDFQNAISQEQLEKNLK